MQKVTTIHLAGRSYQLEEDGYHKLKSYLDEASNALENNPDRDEILADLEVALSEKCSTNTNVHKNVITTKEVEDMLAQMGPVHGAHGKTDTQAASPKRLYRILNGAWISGVCNGIAAYFNIDALVIRIIFIILAIGSLGFAIVLYLLMIVLVPVARTAAEHASATGTAPITAHEVMNRVRNEYSRVKKSHSWRYKK
ncbi:MAG: phage shock protein PspC [Candidatus Adlerbacteria bacterium]|nr:phage shock protein PspC [Candidatus Adlerbacteria bacterium]